jgi:hypothetical protein
VQSIGIVIDDESKLDERLGRQSIIMRGVRKHVMEEEFDEEEYLSQYRPNHPQSKRNFLSIILDFPATPE